MTHRISNDMEATIGLKMIKLERAGLESADHLCERLVSEGILARVVREPSKRQIGWLWDTAEIEVIDLLGAANQLRKWGMI